MIFVKVSSLFRLNAIFVFCFVKLLKLLALVSHKEEQYNDSYWLNSGTKRCYRIDQNSLLKSTEAYETG